MQAAVCQKIQNAITVVAPREGGSSTQLYLQFAAYTMQCTVASLDVSATASWLWLNTTSQLQQQGRVSNLALSVSALALCMSQCIATSSSACTCLCLHHCIITAWYSVCVSLPPPPPTYISSPPPCIISGNLNAPQCGVCRTPQIHIRSFSVGLLCLCQYCNYLLGKTT